MHGLPLAMFVLAFSTGPSAGHGAPPGRFALGNVDLVALAASTPPIESVAPAELQPEPTPTCRELHARVESFLASDVKTEIAAARWRLTWAEQRAVIDPGGNVSDSWSALFVAVLGAISYTATSGVRDARSCVSFLEGYDGRVRALRDGVPETGDAAPAGFLERWERVSAELRENVSCHRRR